MSNDTDSNEEAIWNYKCISKAKEKCKEMSKRILQKRCHQKNASFSVLQGKCTHSENEQRTKISKTETQVLEPRKKEIVAVDVVDVDLEFDYEFISPVPLLTRKDSDKAKKGTLHFISKSSTETSILNAKTSAFTKLMSPKKNPGVQTPKRARMKKETLSKKMCVSSKGLTCSPKSNHIIQSFFNSTSKSKGRKNSEMLDHQNSSDDDLFVIKEEKLAIKCGREKGGNNSTFSKYPLDQVMTGSASEANQNGKHDDMSETHTTRKEYEQETLIENCKHNNLNSEEHLYTQNSIALEQLNKVIIMDSDFKVSEFSNTTKSDLKISKFHETTEKHDNISATYAEQSSDKLEGGFLLDNDASNSSDEDRKLRNIEIHEAFSSQNDMGNSGTISSTSAITSSSIVSGLLSISGCVEENHADIDKVKADDGVFPTSTDFTNLHEKTFPMSARKQTSIFSFFKAKFQSKPSMKKNLCEQGANSFHNITARSSLHHRKKVAGISSSVSPASPSCLSSKTDKSNFVKSVLECQPDEEGKKQEKKSANKQCPFYKRIPGTGITVDAFRYGVVSGCEAYFLTHFHYDHYGGLTKRFAQPIYCSQVTGNLVEKRLGVHQKWINCLPMRKPCQVAGVSVTFMDANHCPGAVIILFELKDGRKILHTGDFRASPEMEEYSELKGTVISELYLDTTYCNPSYAFPAQNDAINFVCSLVLKYITDNPNLLIVCGAYTIGKEKIFTAIAQTLDSKISVTNDKKKILDCLEDPELQARLTLDFSKGQVHVVPMGLLNLKYLSEHLARHTQFTSILAFQPTGWTHSDKIISLHNLQPKWSRNGIILYGIPYSEHSSFLELKRFVQFIKPKKILPTVNNGNAASREKMNAIFKRWMEEKAGFHKSSRSQQSKLNAWLS